MTFLEIKAMRLRIAGVSPQQARVIGQQVAQALARRVESLSTGRQLSGLDLKIRMSEGQTPEQLTETIVQTILARIAR